MGGRSGGGMRRGAGLFRRTAGNRSIHRRAPHIIVGGGPLDRPLTHNHTAYGGTVDGPTIRGRTVANRAAHHSITRGSAAHSPVTGGLATGDRITEERPSPHHTAARLVQRVKNLAGPPDARSRGRPSSGGHQYPVEQAERPSGRYRNRTQLIRPCAHEQPRDQ